MFNLRFFSSLLFCLFVYQLTFAQPANDDCSGAELLVSGSSCTNTNGNLTGVTISTQPSSNTKNDVWYSFVANTTKHYITISGGGNFKPGIELYSGSCGGSMTIEGSYTSNSTSLWGLFSNLIIGQTYLFKVYNTNTQILDNPKFTVCVQDFILNDECTGAIELKSNASCNSTYGITYGATQSQVVCSGTAAQDVWYKFQATNTTHYITVTTGSKFNPVFQLFKGSCSGLINLKCMNNNAVGVEETHCEKGLTIGDWYYIRIYDFNNPVSTEPYINICITNPPVNDECTGAISMTPEYTCQSEEGDGTYATQSLAAGSGKGNANDDVWFKFKADTTFHFINVEASTDYDPVVQVFSNCGTTPSPLSPVFYDDASFVKNSKSSAKVTGLSKGLTYYYRVYDAAGTNPSTMNFSTCVTSVPKNDECNGALIVNPASSCYSVDGDGTYATQSLASTLGTPNDDVWFKFTAQKSTQFINVNSSWLYDPVVEVFSTCGTSPTPLTPTFKNDLDYPVAGLGYKAVTGLTPGVTYYYRVYDKSSTNPITMTFKTCVTNPPTNDDCIGSTIVNVGNICDPELGKSMYATESVAKCTGNTGAANDDVWYKFTAQATSQFISVTPEDSKYDPVVELYSACGTTPTKFTTPAFCEDTKYPNGNFGAGLVSGLTIGNVYFYRVYDLSPSNQDTMTFSTCVVNATPNDECPGAIDIVPSQTCNSIVGDGTYATLSLKEVAGNLNASNDDVWFSFTATKTTQFISVTPDDSKYDPVVQVFSNCPATTSVVFNDVNYPIGKFGTTPITGLTVGTKYYYRVYDKNVTNQDTMTFKTCVVEPVNNNDCVGAVDITPSASTTLIAGDGTYASESLAKCSGSAGAANDDVWYSFTAATTKEFISVTAPAGYDPVVEVYSACNTPILPAFCENNAYPKGGFGTKAITTVPGTKYYYRVYDISTTNTYPMGFTTSVTHAPVNDDCAGAITVSAGTTCSSVAGDGTYATQSLAAVSGYENANDDVWYTFTATNTTQNIYVNSSTDYDPVVQVYLANCSTTFPAIATNSVNDVRFPKNGDGSWSVTGLTVGLKYFYRVYDQANTSVTPPVSPLTFTTCVTTPPLPPVNDNPCSATLITPSTSCTYLTYTNEAATNSIGVPPPSCKSPANGDVWFKVKVPFSGMLDFETKSGSVTDLGMAIYKGSCSNLAEVDCDYRGSSNSGSMSKLSFTGLTPGDTLRVRIWEIGNDNNGTFGLCVTRGPEAQLVGPCTNLDFENDLTGWFGTYGNNNGDGTKTYTQGVVNPPAGAPAPYYFPSVLNNTTKANQFTIMNNGFDSYGGFPKVFQGSKTLRLGFESNKNDGRSIEQYFKVTSTNNFFVYNYAVVLNNGFHTGAQLSMQPHFKVEFYDDDGKQIGCGDYLVAGVPAGSTKSVGFNNSLIKNPTDNTAVSYKPWTTIGVDLTKYIGKNIHVRFTTTSCANNNHFGYVYLDCACAPFEIEKPAKVCLGDTARLYAPKGGLSYVWKDATGKVVGTKDSLTYKTTASGKFKFTVDLTMFGTTMCESVLETEIEVGPSPTLIITNPTAVCEGNTVDITTDETTDGSTDNLTFSYWKDNPPSTPITDQAALTKGGTYFIKGEKGPLCMDIKPVVVKINPIPKIADKTAVICSDDSVKLVPLFVATDVIPSDTKYKWTIETNSSNITGQSTEATGKSDIKNKLSNKVNTAQKIKYKITPFTPTCEGTPFYFEITVNPKPQIKDSTLSICSDIKFNIDPKDLSTNVVPSGTTYTWIFKENTNVTNESNSATDESTIKSYTQNLINTTNTIQTVEHRVSPKSGTCVGDTFKIIINVNPAPKIPDSLMSICTNTTFNTTPVHTGTRFIIPSGTTYTWATPTLSGAIVGSSAQTNQTTISQTLINNTTTNQTAAYAITANSNTVPNCSSIFYDTITVEPKIKPVITCGTSSSTTLEFKWDDIPGATSYEYVYKVGATGTLSSPPQSISAGISPRITSTTITRLSAGNNVYFTLTPVGILCPLPETKLCSNCVQPTIVNTVTPTDFEICIGETIRLKASEAPTNTNQWSIVTNNIISNTINSSKDLMDITGLKAGTTDIEFENDAGCKNSITVTVNPKPEIAKIIKSICYGGLFDTIPNNNILTSNVVPTGTTYTWALPATSVSGVTGITTGTAEASFKQNLTNGTNVSKVIDYKVKASSGTAPNTCSNDFDVSVTLNPTPKIAPINKVLCSTDAFDTIPNNTSLSTNIVPAGTTYTWDLPTILTGINGALAENTNTKTSFKQTLTNTTNNSIVVNYIVTAKSGTIPDQCTSTFNTTLTVNPTPKIDNITLAICSEETFDTIPDNSSPNSIPAGTKYSWNIGVPPTGISGITAGIDQSSIKQTLKNITANPIDVIYTITATSGVVPNQCTKTFTLTAKVNPTPKIITVDTIKICENIKTFNQFNLNETGGVASSWEWSSNLTTSLAIIENKNTSNPSVKNGINGEAFKVIGTDINGCKNSDTTILKILPLPIFTPTVDTACVNGTLTFKANLNLPGQTNAWSGPNGYTNSNESFQLTNVSLNKAGKYYIKITGANTCSKLDSVIASIHPLPVFTPSYTKPCENTPLIIRSNYKKGVSYVWSGPNSYALTTTVDSTKITTLAIPATHSGDYYVEITDTNTCVKKEKVTVNIFPKPTVSATNSIQICANIKSFTLDETATDAISWIWTSNQFAKFKDKSSEKPTVTEATDGEIFKVIGKDANGCIDSATTILSINPIPVITPKEVCVDKRVTLTATHTPATSNAWKSENVGIATIDPTSGEMLGVAGGKTNIIYIDNKGCTDTSMVTINALPKITTLPLEVCEESTLQLKADHTAAPLNGWKSSVPSNATISNTGLVQGIKTGVSSIEFKDSKGCTTKEELTVNLKPVADFKAIYESICVTDSLFLIDKSKPLSNTYIWSFGDGISSKHNAHKYLIEGVFDITLVSITNKGCTDTMTKNKYIEVIGLPKVTFSFTPDSIDIFEPEIRFMNHSNAKHYEWVFGDGLPISVQENPTHTFPTTTGQHYTVTLTGYNTENGCSTSYSQMIVAKEPLIYYIPNTFTPNGDEYNNAFKPIFYSGLDVYNYHLIIYNRWGEVIFESFNVDFGWDGTYGNQIVETATYIWKLEFKEKNKENTHSKTGHVNVLK